MNAPSDVERVIGTVILFSGHADNLLSTDLRDLISEIADALKSQGLLAEPKKEASRGDDIPF